MIGGRAAPSSRRLLAPFFRNIESPSNYIITTMDGPSFYTQCELGTLQHIPDTLSGDVLTAGLKFACMFGNFDVVRLIVTHANQNGAVLIMPSWSFEHDMDTFEYLMTHNVGVTLDTLTYICTNDYIKTFMCIGIDVEIAKVAYPKCWKAACNANSFEIIKYMIDTYPQYCNSANLVNPCIILRLLNSNTCPVYFNTLHDMYKYSQNAHILNALQHIRQKYHTQICVHVPDVLAGIIIEYLPY
jgi:hypothetical protein